MPFLNEVDYSPDEGQAEAAFIAHVGEATLKLWDTQCTPPADWVIYTDHIRQDWQTFMHDVAMNHE